MTGPPTTCPACKPLCLASHIRTPTDLERCIDAASRAIQGGLLRDEGAGRLGDPFAKLADGPGWGDFVDNHFSCTACGQHFRLHAETHHGFGGAFERCAPRSQGAGEA
jgi:hypothetical protein